MAVAAEPVLEEAVEASPASSSSLIVAVVAVLKVAPPPPPNFRVQALFLGHVT